MGKLQENNFNVPCGRRFPNDDDGEIMPFYVVADYAYGLSNSVLQPYAKQNPSYNKQIYNYRHTRACQMVGCTFGILANKWHVFHRPLDVNIDFLVSIIKACCILHNLVRTKDGIQFADTLYFPSFENLRCSGDNRGRNLTGGVMSTST